MTLQNADVPSADLTIPVIKPKCTEPYFTRMVLAIEKSKHTWGRWTPPLIKPKCTEPYYTRMVLAMEKSRHTQGRWTPLIDPRVQSPMTPGQY